MTPPPTENDSAQLFPGLYPEIVPTNSIDDRPAKPVTTVRIECVGGPLGAPSSKRKGNWAKAGHYLRFSSLLPHEPEVPDMVDFPKGVYRLVSNRYLWTALPSVK